MTREDAIRKARKVRALALSSAGPEREVALDTLDLLVGRYGLTAQDMDEPTPAQLPPVRPRPWARRPKSRGKFRG